MQTAERQPNHWKMLHDATRSLAARLPFLRPMMRLAWIDGLRTALAERAVSGHPDRIHMEKTILPALAAGGFRRVLFVGCRRYTTHYGRWFTDRGIEYWTTDIDPNAGRWGDKHHHVTADVRDLDRHFEPHSFDLVLLNGVFGFGVDEPDAMNRTLDTLHTLMMPDGLLLVGWNQGLIPDPARLARMRAQFHPVALPPLPQRKAFADDIGHVYDFYRAD